jgi:hypothetical protein
LKTLRSLLFPCSSPLTARRLPLAAVSSLLTAVLLTAAFASTPGKDTLVNYDTAWTFVYDGGKSKTGLTMYDILYDVKPLTNGVCVCVGLSGDVSSDQVQFFLIKIDASGKIVQKKLLGSEYDQYAHSIAIARNGDFLIGGARYGQPYVMRTDSLGNLKWARWYYDSTNQNSRLQGKGTINSIKETSKGVIICAAGDPYPYNDGDPLNNYAAFLVYDSLGTLVNWNEWDRITGYTIGGYEIEETATGYYLLSGNQAVFNLDSNGTAIWKKAYTFSLDGVGTVTNNVYKAKMLRDKSLMVMGQAYEGNCWTRFNALSWDAWWSPISYTYGANSAWDTAGYQGGDDILYNFTQLKNGNLVFIGKKSPKIGIWMFVTDSTGKKILWEKNRIRRPYLADTSAGDASTAFSVCATDDGGFTIVGDMSLSNALGAHNGFIAHFIPKPVSAVTSRSESIKNFGKNFAVHQSSNKLVVNPIMPNGKPFEVSLFDISGKRILNQSGIKETTFDVSKLSKGTYFVKVGQGTVKETEKIVFER